MARFTPASRVALFWAAFVLTRPLGATGGDLLTKGADHGGLGLGTEWSSLVLAAILIGMLLGRIGTPQGSGRVGGREQQ